MSKEHATNTTNHNHHEDMINKTIHAYQLRKQLQFQIDNTYINGIDNIDIDINDIENLLNEINIPINDINIHTFLNTTSPSTSISTSTTNNSTTTSSNDSIPNDTNSIPIARFRQLISELKLYDVFTQIDEDNSGSIDESEIGLAMRKLGYKINNKRCSTMMKQLDTNSDGVISFDEFLEFFSAFPHGSYEKTMAAWMEASDTTDCGSDMAPTVPTLGLKWWQTVIAGGTAGVLARTMTAPLERLKIAAQTGRLTSSSGTGGGMLQELKSVYRDACIIRRQCGQLHTCLPHCRYYLYMLLESVDSNTC